MKKISGRIDFYITGLPSPIIKYKISGTNHLCVKFDNESNWVVIDKMPENTVILGLLSAISEDDAKLLVSTNGIEKGEIIDDYVVDEDIIFGYKNYSKSSDIRDAVIDVAEYDTAKESLKSLLKSNNCFIIDWLEYPMKEHYIPDHGIQKYPQEYYNVDLLRYLNAPVDYLIILNR